MSSPSKTDSATAELFEGPGEMRALCRDFDWASTALGPVEQWPISLRTTVKTLLASRHPMFLWWGPDLIQIYNDAYRPSLGSSGRHVTAVGAKGAEFWTEIWHIISPDINDVLAGGPATWYEDQLVPIERNGAIEDVWWTYSYGPAFDDEGHVAGVLVVCQETTARVRSEQRLTVALRDAECARTDAERANRSKSEFLTVMSHELRTPLNAIGGYTELLELGVRGPMTPEQITDLGRIRKSQRHLLGLINDVLNYTRVESSTMQYDIARVPVEEVLRNCEALTAPQIAAKNIELVVEPCDSSLAVMADRDRLQQIVLNLLTNAAKFTSSGGRVTLGCVLSDDTATIYVSDTGRGIPRDQLGRIFEPFVQVDARLTRTEEGIGLGLAISRDLARGMHGDLTVESEVDVGSTFRLTLPRAD